MLSARHRSGVLSLYKRVMRAIPAYCSSPGVRDFLYRELQQDLAKQGAPAESLAALENEINTPDGQAYIESVTKSEIRGLFRMQAGETDPKLAAQLLSKGEEELHLTKIKIIDGKAGMIYSGPR